MFILNFLRYIQGYVRFQAHGVFVERFLNLLARDRIPVWNGRKRGDSYTGCVRASYYKRLRAHAKKTGVHLNIQDKAGAPFRRRKYRRRAGLLVGFSIFVLFLACMSGFIWRIEVNGNERLEDSEIIAALDRIGVHTGSWRGSIDVRESERLAMLALEDLSWVALNIRGSTIYVEVTERTAPPEMIDPNTPCNVVAGYTGQIISMRVYDGQAMLQEGDTVMAGDIIVSGITQDRLGQNLFRHALAQVTARVDLTLRVEVPLVQTQYVERGDTANRRYLQLLSLDLPLHLPGRIEGPYRVNRTTTTLRLLGFNLPVSVLLEEHVLMEEAAVTYTEEQAKDLALEELALVEKARLEGAEILDRKLTAVLEGGVFYLEADYDCVMEIGVEKEILQDENVIE